MISQFASGLAYFLKKMIKADRFEKHILFANFVQKIEHPVQK